MVVNPNLLASLCRTTSPCTRRSSPKSPSSPKLANLSGKAIFLKAETMDKAIGKSVAGSLSLSPPETLTNTSKVPRGRFKRFCKMAKMTWSRL